MGAALVGQLQPGRQLCCRCAVAQQWAGCRLVVMLLVLLTQRGLPSCCPACASHWRSCRWHSRRSSCSTSAALSSRAAEHEHIGSRWQVAGAAATTSLPRLPPGLTRS